MPLEESTPQVPPEAVELAPSGPNHPFQTSATAPKPAGSPSPAPSALITFERRILCSFQQLLDEHSRKITQELATVKDETFAAVRHDLIKQYGNVADSIERSHNLQMEAIDIVLSRQVKAEETLAARDMTLAERLSGLESLDEFGELVRELGAAFFPGGRVDTPDDQPAKVMGAFFFLGLKVPVLNVGFHVGAEQSATDNGQNGTPSPVKSSHVLPPITPFEPLPSLISIPPSDVRAVSLGEIS